MAREWRAKYLLLAADLPCVKAVVAKMVRELNSHKNNYIRNDTYGSTLRMNVTYVTNHFKFTQGEYPALQRIERVVKQQCR